ncbi:hypothetical protein MRX96_041838 [Rhipicephalus microplus]
MRTWVLCLLLGLVCLIAISIATLTAHLWYRRNERENSPSSDLSMTCPTLPTTGTGYIAAGRPQSLLAPQDPLPDAYLVPSAGNSPDTPSRGSGNNDLETNVDVLSATDISIAVEAETTTPATVTSPPLLLETTEDGRPLVNTTTGMVAGFKTEVLGRKLDVFLGIPFATPPLGALRFKKPLPVKPWENVLDAKEMGPPCYHISFASSWNWAASKKPESEDCLHLNVWTPNRHNATKASSQLRPMLVFIYGGGFNIGATDWEFYDGGVLAAYGDVVVASMNYRLGALGFLNADIEDIPGNMGLYDQNLALRWLHENAEILRCQPRSFGANGRKRRRRVSGPAPYFAPMSRNMVKRVILQSGSPLWDTPDNTADGVQEGDGVRRDLQVLERHAQLPG